MFYRVRERVSRGRYKRAADFIYLNKTCWNGLYRVNSAGRFNVPYGRPKTDVIADPNNLRACGRLLAQPGVKLRIADFEAALLRAQANDLVFLDPPYVTGHNNNGFVDYNETLFNWRDQIRLAVVARRLSERGVHVVVTNACHDEVLELYPGFKKKVLNRFSTIASAPEKRRPTSEALIYSVHQRR